MSVKNLIWTFILVLFLQGCANISKSPEISLSKYEQDIQVYKAAAAEAEQQTMQLIMLVNQINEVIRQACMTGTPIPIAEDYHLRCYKSIKSNYYEFKR